MKNLKDYVITVIGDSISKGVYLDNGKIEKVNNSAIDIIQKELDCNIVNESSFGQTLERAYNKKLFAQYLESLDKSKKNILVLSLGGNDSDYDWKQVSQQPTLPHSSKTDADTFYHTLTEIITQAKASGVEVIVTSLSPIDSERYFVNVLSNNYNADNIYRFLDNDVNNLYRHQELFNSILTKCAIENNCPFIDYRSNMLKQNDMLNLISEDGIHPNEKGHKLIAETVVDFVNKKHC